jgi:hypothetical protein
MDLTGVRPKYVRLSKLKPDTSSFGRKKTDENERSFFYDQTIVGIVLLVSLQVLNSAKPIFFCYYFNRKDMTCHESKISFFKYVR